MKKLLSVLLSIIVVCVSSFQVQAENTKNINITAEIKQLIATELSYYEQCKYVVDMENIDFTNLYVSDKINVYEYLPSGFVKISEAYLIYETDRIVTLAYLVNDEQVQIMTSLAHLIAETDVESLALVYDEDGAFVYDGINFRQIFHDPSRKVEDRANIANVTEEQKESISLIDSNNTQRLEYYSNSTNARAQTNYVL